MSIFLLVLKILGITLLSIIGLVLLILCLVLFVPVRYKLDGSYENDPDANARVTWLLHLVSLRLSYTKDGLTKSLRILGIPIKKREKKAKKPKKEKKTKKKEKSENRLPQEEELTLEGFAEEKPSAEVQESEVKTETFTTKTEAEEEEQGFFSKLREFIQKIYDWIVHFSEKIRDIYNKIRSAVSDAAYYLDLLTDSHNQETILYALKQICLILRSICPKKWNLYARFGFEEPDTTGKILAIAALLHPFTGPRLSLDPVYDEKVLCASGMAKGRVFLITVLIVAWRLYFNKDLKKVIKALKKEA